jgi:hypothetical protein
MSYCLCHFPRCEVDNTFGKIILIGSFFKITFNTKNNIFKWPERNYTPIDFCEQAEHILSTQTNFTVSLRPLYSLLVLAILKRYWSKKNGLI